MSVKRPRVAMVIADNYEDIEADSPKAHLESLGADVVLIGLTGNPARGKKGGSLKPDATFDNVAPGEFEALVIPGGGAPENLRIDDRAVAFAKEFIESGRPVAAICHGPQLLISAKVLDGRTLTSVNKIRDDVKNAGGHYVDEPIVVDGNLITSRVPADLDHFNAAIAKAVGLAAG